MRTTVDLPDDLIRTVKARAAERGESLKEFFARAVAHEARTMAGSPDSTRVRLPLVAGDGPAINVTNADIEAALEAEDANHYGGR